VQVSKRLHGKARHAGTAAAMNHVPMERNPRKQSTTARIVFENDLLRLLITPRDKARVCIRRCLDGCRPWQNLDFTLATCAAMIRARLVCNPAARMRELLAAIERRS